MNPSRVEIFSYFDEWLMAWDKYNLEGILRFLHDDIMFENWDGRIIAGKNALRKAWIPWFSDHGNFKFFKEDLFLDENEQKMTFIWQLEWPSFEKKYAGKKEIRRGVDILHLLEGKIIKKYTYSKTTIQIDSVSVSLSAF